MHCQTFIKIKYEQMFSDGFFILVAINEVFNLLDEMWILQIALWYND